MFRGFFKFVHSIYQRLHCNVLLILRLPLLVRYIFQEQPGSDDTSPRHTSRPCHEPNVPIDHEDFMSQTALDALLNSLDKKTPLEIEQDIAKIDNMINDMMKSFAFMDEFQKNESNEQHEGDACKVVADMKNGACVDEKGHVDSCQPLVPDT